MTYNVFSGTLNPTHFTSLHFTQSVSSFLNICPCHRNLFCCNIKITSSIPSLSLNSLLGTPSFTLTLHIHLTILISAHSLPCSILLRTQLLCSLPLLINHISLLVSNGTKLSEFIPSNSDSGLHGCISSSAH